MTIISNDASPLPFAENGSDRTAADDDTGRSGIAGTQTLMRGLTLIECVAEGVNDPKRIAARLKAPRSTVHRMLSSLVAAGYLHHVPYQGYSLGPKLIMLGSRALEQRPIVALARPHLEALAERTGDTVHLGSQQGDEVLYLDKIPGRRGLEMRSRIGQRMPLATTGLGKALMLGIPRADWRDNYDRALKRVSADGQPLPWPAYEQSLIEAGGRGYAFDLEENELGIRCVAAPIRDIEGRVVAAVSVASAVSHMTEERLASLGPAVSAAADDVSRELGWRPEAR
jgi:DNA-binding IclR family transcriptional regulator